MVITLSNNATPSVSPFTPGDKTVILATATRILNAIPAVVAAPPGLLSVLDLPLVTGTHLLS